MPTKITKILDSKEIFHRVTSVGNYTFDKMTLMTHLNAIVRKQKQVWRKADGHNPDVNQFDFVSEVPFIINHAEKALESTGFDLGSVLSDINQILNIEEGMGIPDISVFGNFFCAFISHYELEFSKCWDVPDYDENKFLVLRGLLSIIYKGRKFHYRRSRNEDSGVWLSVTLNPGKSPASFTLQVVKDI